MQVTCNTCSLNVAGYCMSYDSRIPIGAGDKPHDCDRWQRMPDDDVLDYLARLGDKHEAHREAIWRLRDLVDGKVHLPHGERMSAYRFLWTSPLFLPHDRSWIASQILPF